MSCFCVDTIAVKSAWFEGETGDHVSLQHATAYCEMAYCIDISWFFEVLYFADLKL